MAPKSRAAMWSMRIGAACCVLPCGESQAAFTGLSHSMHTTVETPTGSYAVWRVYATFSAPDDRLYSWGGTVQFPSTVKSIACYPQEVPGGDFFNPIEFWNSAPTQRMIEQFYLGQWDTFATIGVNIAEQGSGPPEDPDVTAVFSLPIFINGNQVSFTGFASAVGNGPEFAQNRADYAADGNLSLIVLMMQLTLPVEDQPIGMIRQLTWKPASGPPVTVSNLAFTPNPLFYGHCCMAPGDDCSFTWEFVCEAGLGGVFIGCEPCSQCCLCDLNRDQTVDLADLLMVIGDWGPCGPCPPAGDCTSDIDNDCAVGVPDLLAAISAWGECP